MKLRLAAAALLLGAAIATGTVSASAQTLHQGKGPYGCQISNTCPTPVVPITVPPSSLPPTGAGAGQHASGFSPVWPIGVVILLVTGFGFRRFASRPY